MPTLSVPTRKDFGHLLDSPQGPDPAAPHPRAAKPETLPTTLWLPAPPQCSKIFFSETAWSIKAKFYVEPHWVGGKIFCSRHLGHITKMAATPTYGKNPSKIFFSRTGGPIFTKLGIYHQGLLPFIVCSNDDPGMTLTYFTARSNLVT